MKTKSTYRVRLSPAVLQLAGTGLSRDSLERSIAGVVVREVINERFGNHVLDLELTRNSHEEALNEILIAAQQLGYSIVEATVSEWADQLIEQAAAGALGAGTVTGLATKNPEAAVAVGLVGMIIGGIAGAHIEKIKAVYAARPTYPSGWQLVRISDEPPGELRTQLA